MIGFTARQRITPLLAFCLWTRRTAGYVPVPFNIDKYYGVDGPVSLQYQCDETSMYTDYA